MSVLRNLPVLAIALSAVACGSSDEQPPLDQLTLRDALLAEPAVVAHLQAAAQQHLQTRFVQQRLQPDATTEAAAQSSLPMLNQVVAMDAVRFSGGRDALLTGVWQPTPTKVLAVVYTAPGGQAPAHPLPALSGDLSGDTLASEQHALSGAAGALIEELMVSSGAQNLQRVVSWPIAALATADTVYVNASWLVAMDTPAAGQSGSGTPPAGTGSASGLTHKSGNRSGLYTYLVTSSDSAQTGAAATTDPQNPDSTGAAQSLDAPNAATGSSSDLCSSSSSSCNNSSSDCSSSSSSSNNSCNNNSSCDPQDKSCCRACTVGGAPQNPVVPFGALLWLLAPLGFLLRSDRRAAALLRRAEVGRTERAP